jgi:galactose mutarotase-like enzyme
MKLYGQDWTRREIEARVGRIEQIGGIRRFQMSEGPEAGVEQIQVRTGAGLTYYVSPSRCMDISLAEFGGVPFSWQSANGDVHPSYFDAAGIGWLRTAVGGLLMTCGLTQVGSPCEDEGQELGIHGRSHHLAARQVSSTAQWLGDEYVMQLSGVIQETAIFQENLCLTRKIRSKLGKNRIEIEDTVENLGFEPTPHMILYHFNFGFPLMSEGTEIDFPSKRVVPRESKTPVQGYNLWHSPEAGYQERVYYHQEIIKDDNNFACAKISNPRFPIAAGECALSVVLSWSTSQLPKLVQWKMPGAGIHVLGIEPANCYVEGRAVERNRGGVRTLDPGESHTYEINLELFID